MIFEDINNDGSASYSQSSVASDRNDERREKEAKESTKTEFEEW